MCGIALIAYSGLDAPPVEPARLAAMTSSLRHRGPDAQATWIDPTGRVGLGHARLSVLDLEGGAQPMHDPATGCVIVFNGEIYNFVPLREALAAQGAVFRTRSDTEVLLQAYVAWGEACVHRLEGMFAFAIHDPRDHSLFLARDPIGIKPLYLARRPGELLAASELRTLALFRREAPQLDPAGFAQYVTMGYTLAPDTLLAGITQLPHGHWARSRDGQLRVRRYADLADAANARAGEILSDVEAERALEERVERAVKAQMRADVPVGLFLSGGVDSTLVCGVAARLPGEARETFTADFDVPGYREADRAAETARVLDLPFFRVPVDAGPPAGAGAGGASGDSGGRPASASGVAGERSASASGVAGERSASACGVAGQRSSASDGASGASLSDRWAEEAWATDAPLFDNSFLPTRALCEAARRRVTVVLSGDGGDELFLGYETYRADAAARWLRPLARLGAGPLSRLAERVPVGFGKVTTAYKLRAFARAFARTPAAAHCGWRELAGEGLLARLLTPEWGAHLRTHHPAARFEAAFARVPEADFLTRLSYVDCETWLPNDILVKADRASMAHGLEVRVPLLDWDIARFALGLPDARKTRLDLPKRLLRVLASRRVPGYPLRSPKRGFNAPMSEWLAGPLSPALDTLRRRDAELGGVVRPDVLQHMIDAHRAARDDHGLLLWALLVLEAWLGRLRVERGRVGASWA